MATIGGKHTGYFTVWWLPTFSDKIASDVLSFQISSLLIVLITCTLIVSLSARFWSVSVGICVHSVTRVLVRSDTYVGWGCLGCCLHSNSSQRCWLGLRSGHFVGHWRSSTPRQTFMDLTCSGASSCWNMFQPLSSIKGNCNAIVWLNTHMWAWCLGVHILLTELHKRLGSAS